jgi:hypothetical protein
MCISSYVMLSCKLITNSFNMKYVIKFSYSKSLFFLI